MSSAGWLGRLRADGGGTTAVEFAIVAMPFLMLLVFVFELSFDLFSQSVLDNALQLAARQLQTGNAQNVRDGNAFVASYMCPALGGLLSCGSVYVDVQRIVPTSTQDYYNYTTGSAPVSAGVLDLGAYSAGSFCNPGPSQLLLVSAVYVGPSFIGSLLPGVLTASYNGQLVHPTFSSVGIVSEAYTPTAATQSTAPPC